MVALPFALFEGWALGTLHPRDAPCSTPRRFVSHKPLSRSRTGDAFVGVRHTWWLAGLRRASGCVVPAALGFHPELSRSLRSGLSLSRPCAAPVGTNAFFAGPRRDERDEMFTRHTDA